MTRKKNTKSRREFIKYGLTGLAGSAFFPIGTHGNSDKSVHPETDRKFIYRKLGKTGLSLPVIGMGVMNADNPQLVQSALEQGIILLDTAHYYSRGRNERMVGEVIKNWPRNSLVIATKARASTIDREHAPEGDAIRDETVASFIKKVELSLERLKLDYVDILYLHSAKTREDALNKTVLEAMRTLKKQGKIRFIGISTHSNEHEVIQAAVDSNLYEVVLTAYNFRMKNGPEVKQAIATAAASGLGIVAMKTQAGVYWDKLRKHPINMTAALKWALQDKNVHTAIPGFTTFDQLNQDLEVMTDLTLSPREKTDLKLNSEQAHAGLYCQQCRKCVSQCPHKQEIPVLMRAYMYAYGYRNLNLARDTIQSLNLNEIRCTDCTHCPVSCEMDFRVREKILDIIRIKDIPGDLIA